MKTELLPAGDPAALRRAVALLRDGSSVAFPTDTVYGLGADAFQPEAVAELYRAKGRPADKAMPLLLASPEQLEQVVSEVSPLARRLAEHFWPGGLTLVLPARPTIPAIVTAGGTTVAVRIPNHPVAQALITAVGVPLATTSANRSGRPSPVTAGAVLADLDGLIPLILDGGVCPGGIESTVVEVSRETLRILRRGAIGDAALQAVCTSRGYKFGE